MQCKHFCLMDADDSNRTQPNLSTRIAPDTHMLYQRSVTSEDNGIRCLFRIITYMPCLMCLHESAVLEHETR